MKVRYRRRTLRLRHGGRRAVQQLAKIGMLQQKLEHRWRSNPVADDLRALPPAGMGNYGKAVLSRSTLTSVTEPVGLALPPVSALVLV